MNISFTRIFGLVAGILLAGSPRITAQNDPVCFQLFFPTISALPGDTVCVPLMVRDFELIASMQFTTTWDNSELELLNLDYYVDSDLAEIEAWNFSLNQTGVLAFSWLDFAGMGISLPDSSVLFTLCFRVKDGANGFCKVNIDPTISPRYEVVQLLPPDWNSVMMPYTQKIGGVFVGVDSLAALTIESFCVTNSICNIGAGGASVVISGGQPPYYYAWSGPDHFSDTVASIVNVISGTYNLTVTDQTGSSISAETFINAIPSVIYANIVTTKSLCGQANGCATLEVNGQNPPFSFEWSTGNNQTAANCELIPGQHIVTITDGLGCLEEVSVQILNQEAISIVLTRQNIYSCHETGTASVSVSPEGDYQFLWSNGETTATIDSLLAGRYFVKVTAPGGCSSTGNISIIDYTTSHWQLKLLPICADEQDLNGNILLQFNPASNGIEFPATVSWSDGTTRLFEEKPLDNILDTLADIPSGNYSVKVTDVNGCVGSSSNVLYCESLPPAPTGFPAFFIQDDFLTPQYATDSCAGVYGRNISDMLSLEFTLLWSTNYAELKEVKNLNLPGLTLDDFTIMNSQGKLDLKWASVNPITIPDDSLLFEVCLTAKSQSITTYLSFTDTPTAPKITGSFGLEQPFIGRGGDVLFGPYFPPGPSVCEYAAIPSDCTFDGESRILLGSCDPDKFLIGECSRKDSNGIFQPYGNLNSLLFAKEGTYRITAVQAASSPNYFLAHVPSTPPTTECVWPGDADNNNAVNHHDLLYLGLAYGASGDLRNEASIFWEGQDCQDWTQSTLVRHVNFKNIDSNGDGIINISDTTAIVQNWGRVINPVVDNPFALPQENLGGDHYPMLSLPSDTLEAGESVALPLTLGSADMPMDNMYGLAFSISYDPNLVNKNVFFKPSSSWFGDSTQYIFLQKNFPLQGHLDVAITRTDGVPVSGWGAIGNVFIIIEDNIFGEPDPLEPSDTILKTRLFFSGLNSLNATENAQGIDANPTELIIQRSTSGTKSQYTWEKNISMFPNPANETLYVLSKGANILRVEIISIEGQMLQQLNLDSESLQVPLKNLPGGNYILRISTEKGVAIKHVQIQH